MNSHVPAFATVLFLATGPGFAQEAPVLTAPEPIAGTIVAPELAQPQMAGNTQSLPMAPTEADVPVNHASPSRTGAVTASENSALPTITNAMVPLVDTGLSSSLTLTGTEITAKKLVPVQSDAVDKSMEIEPISQNANPIELAEDAWNISYLFLKNGGPSIWAIAGLAVITLALILWKVWRLALAGAWSRGKAGKAVDAFETGHPGTALSIVQGRMGIRSKVVAAAVKSVRDMPEDRAREETARVAKHHLAQASVGLGALELIATIAPLLGLLGTVLGMIAAFQALQEAGSKADPALLAGGIWEALLTTAAGMAVAIPASVSLTWFEAVISRIRRDMEDSTTRIFVYQEPRKLNLAAE